MQYLTVSVGPLSTNCYIVYDQTAVIIDPGDESELIMSKLNELSVPLTHIIYTHGHWDHTGAAAELKSKTTAEVVMGKNEIDIFESVEFSNLAKHFNFQGNPAKPDRYVDDGDIILSGNIELKVIYTPGHSPGSISLYTNGWLFSGDTIFHNSIGRTDIEGGNIQDLEKSIRNRIYSFADDVKIFPGHGEPTTVAWEKANNMFFQAS